MSLSHYLGQLTNFNPKTEIMIPENLARVINRIVRFTALLIANDQQEIFILNLSVAHFASLGPPIN